MNHDMKISVVISAYNVAQWLGRCVDSVLNQSYTNMEILLIDDGSTDGTPQIVDEYAKKDSRIIPVHQENRGLVAVREKGISMASGQYISFVDGDDVIEPDFLERLLQNAVNYDADISHCGMKYCFYDGRIKLHYGTGEIHIFDTAAGVNELLRGRKIEPSLCNKLYRRELLKDSCLDTSVVNNEDLLRNFVLFGRAKRSVFEDFCGYQYWRRAGSMSNTGFHETACRHLLRARSLIMMHATAETYCEARQSYIKVLTGCYDSAIGVGSDGAKEIRNVCRKELGRMKDDFSEIPGRFPLRAVCILRTPAIYALIHYLRKMRIRARIFMARGKAQQENAR